MSVARRSRNRRARTAFAAPLLVASLLLAGSAASAAAQFGPGARATGLGGAYIGLARGYEAVFWNPANLGLPDRPAFSIGIAQPVVTAASVGPDLLDFDIIADPDFTEREKAEFLDQVPATGAEIRGDAVVPWLSFSTGSFGVGFATTALGKADISRELAELYFDAADDGELNGDDLTSYRVGDTGYRDAAWSSATISYARALPSVLPVAVGASVRGVLGHRLERGRLFEPVIQGDHLLITGIGLNSSGGFGFGLDVGAAAEPVPGLTVGLAIENLFQHMEWDEDLQLLGGEFTTRDLDEDGLDQVVDDFAERPFDPDAAPLEAYTIARDLLAEAYFPRSLRLGAGYRFGGTSLGATFSSTMGGGDLYAGWPRYFAIGAGQRLAVVSLRAGYANSLDGASAITLGTGLDIGSFHITLSGARTTGSDDGPDDAHVTGGRFADRLAAGSGYVATLGLSVVRW